MIRVKICGITRAEDALAAVAAGADALGFVFHAASPRQVSPAQVQRLVRDLPPYVSRVGVFVDAPPEFVRHCADTCGLDTLQLHGDEPPEYCAAFLPRAVVKAFRVRDAASIAELRRYAVQAWLLDTHQPGQAGGTGATFDWSLARPAAGWGRPVILAGGLRPENVAEAIRQVRPYAVDVSSGVEIQPGRKDPGRIRDFIQAVRQAEPAAGQ